MLMSSSAVVSVQNASSLFAASPLVTAMKARTNMMTSAGVSR